MTISEQRRRLRVPYEIDLNFFVKGRHITGATSTNISLKGVFVKTEEKLQEGDSCRVNIVLLGTSGMPPLDIDAKVIRVDRDGAGIEFLEMNADTFAHLRNIVAYNLGDADEVDNELNLAAF